jgi:predicted GNAT family N-acyltransferase
VSARGAEVEVEVRAVRDPGEREAAMALRHEVFVDEQRVPAELEVDEHDPAATHLVALQRGRVLATCRLVADDGAVRLGRLAVARAARRRGLATRLLEAAETWARDHGARALVLSAQTHACGLYEAAGYQRHGLPYDEAGIEHVRMERDLA